MRLGIVGHAAEKFTDITKAKAIEAIEAAIIKYQPDIIASGHSPMGGVDIWAEEAAERHSIPTTIFKPIVNSWGAKGGFKDRNIQIALNSDIVLVVVVKELPTDFKGMKFGGCYHCNAKTPPHVKSGGCWTAWRAPKREWAII